MHALPAIFNVTSDCNRKLPVWLVGGRRTERRSLFALNSLPMNLRLHGNLQKRHASISTTAFYNNLRNFHEINRRFITYVWAIMGCFCTPGRLQEVRNNSDTDSQSQTQSHRHRVTVTLSDRDYVTEAHAAYAIRLD